MFIGCAVVSLGAAVIGVPTASGVNPQPLGVLAPRLPARATVGGAATSGATTLTAPAMVSNASGGGCTTPGRAPVSPAALYLISDDQSQPNAAMAYPADLWSAPAFRDDTAGLAIFAPVRYLFKQTITAAMWQAHRFPWDWSYVNTLVDEARSCGKSFSIALEVGFDDPVPDPVFANCGNGCAPAFHTWSFGNNRCILNDVPLAWKPNVLAFWQSAAASLAADLKAHNTLSSLSLLHITGVSVYDEEVRLPSGEVPVGYGKDVCADDGEKAGEVIPADARHLANYGYSAKKLTSAFGAITSAFAASFPTTKLGLSVYQSGTAFPTIAGQPPSAQVVSDLVAAANKAAPGRLHFQADNLDTTPVDRQVLQFASLYGGVVGWQSNHRGGSGARCSSGKNGSCGPDGLDSPYHQLLENGIKNSGTYLELWANDVVNYPASIEAIYPAVSAAQLSANKPARSG